MSLLAGSTAAEAGEASWDTRQFEVEMRSLCSLLHPNICSLFAFCTDGPQRCLVLELCTGGALDQRLACKPGAAQPPLSWQARVRIAADVCVS